MTSPLINEMDLGSLAPQNQDMFAQMGLGGTPPTQDLLTRLGIAPPPPATPSVTGAQDPDAIARQRQEAEEERERKEREKRSAEFLDKYSRKTPEGMYQEALAQWMPRTKKGKAGAYIAEILRAGFGPPGKYEPVEQRLRKQSMEQYKAMEPILQRMGAVEAADRRAEASMKLAQQKHTENLELKRDSESFKKWNELQKRTNDAMKTGILHDKYQLDADKWRTLGPLEQDRLMSQIEKDYAQAEALGKSHNVVEKVTEMLAGQGASPDQPDYMAKFAEAYKHLQKNPNADLAGLMFVKTTNAYGEVEPKVVSKRQLAEQMARGETPNLGKTWTVADIKEVADRFGAVGTAKNIAEMIASNPKALRSTPQVLASMVPASDKYLQLRDPNERVLGTALGKFLFAQIKAMSGVQFSDKEREAQEALQAKPVDTPENALALLASYAVWESAYNAAKILNRPESLKDDFDTEYVRQLLMKQILASAKTGTLKNFKMPSYQQILEMAARQKGKKVIFDTTGKLRGIE